MDVDICGPSLPTMLGLADQRLHATSSGWTPLYVLDNLCAMSIGFMLPSSSDAVIWRGAKKNGLIKQFLRDVDWGPLDYLVVDTPPGTSDEHLSVVKYLAASGQIDGAVVLTTPQEVALQGACDLKTALTGRRVERARFLPQGRAARCVALQRCADQQCSGWSRT